MSSYDTWGMGSQSIKGEDECFLDSRSEKAMEKKGHHLWMGYDLNTQEFPA